MIKHLLAALAMTIASGAFAAVDANKASEAELDGVKGIGPSLTSRILDERKKSPFKDWNDMIVRVKGLGEGNAARYSAEGLTVNGTSFKKDGAADKPEKTAKADKGEKTAAKK